MTPNWAGAVVNVLIAAFFAVCFIGIGLGVYAARVLKQAEVRSSSNEASADV